MKFSEVLEALENGERLTNAKLSNNDAFIVRQVPQIVPAEVVPKMTSLPDSAKEHMKGSEISYRDQVLLVWWSCMQERYIATSYIPSWEDIFREDWTICLKGQKNGKNGPYFWPFGYGSSRNTCLGC